MRPPVVSRPLPTPTTGDAAPLHVAAGWTLLVVGGATTSAEVPALCARVPRLLGRGCVVVCDVSAVAAPDLAAVGALARLRLDARRRHADLRIEPVSCDLGALLCWTGLAEAVLDAEASC